MKDRVFGVLQRVGRSFMLPIAILPAAGLLMGIGSSLTNETMLRAYHLERILGQGTVWYGIFEVMGKAGNIIFANLPLIFALGVAIGMARKEKEVAALSAAIAFLIMHAAISAMIVLYGGAEAMLEGAVTQVCGITSLQLGVFGGILVGLGVAALHNRFYRIELPQVLSFFGGSRFVPVISALVYTGVGILLYYVWPPVQQGIYAVGDLVLRSGYAGTWIYGLMERLLIPFGLHHVFYLPFWQTALGGTMEVAGQIIEGAQNIFFAQLADPSVQRFAVSATRFMAGKYPLMIFGLPGAALAMYRAALPQKREEAGGLLLSAALTSMVTGITEPLEFTFLFVAPLLYGIHCVLAGAAYMFMHILQVGVGMTFSGGLIDLLLFGILQGNGKTNWIRILPVGAAYFLIYYLVFYLLITKLDLKTPGRVQEGEVKLYRRSDVEADAGNRRAGAAGKQKQVSDGAAGADRAQDAKGCPDTVSAGICRGLGGKDNISDLDCCATRLRCTVKDPTLVDEAELKATGASGVIRSGNGVQIIYGPRVTVIKSSLEEYLESAETEQINEIEIGSPLEGRMLPLDQVPDEAFASGAVGAGAAVIPSRPLVRAPEDGEVLFVFETGHALGYRTESGMSLLIYLGIDTVKLNGSGFDCLVREGQKLKKGDPMIRMDLEYLNTHAPSLASPVVCTELGEGWQANAAKAGEIGFGETLLVLKKTDKR